MISNYILPVTSSITSSFMSGANYRFDKTLGSQNAFFFRGIIQHFAVNQTLRVVGRALLATGRAIPAASIQNVLLVTPILLGIAAGRQFSNRHIRKVCEFAQDHIGLLCRSVTLVSIGILLFNGQVLFASCYIGWMAFEVCFRKYSATSVLPQQIVKIVSLVGTCGIFVVGNWTDRFFITLFIISTLANRWIVLGGRAKAPEFIEKETKAKIELEAPSRILDLPQVVTFNSKNCIVNREVLKAEVLPPVRRDENPQVITDRLNSLDEEFFESLGPKQAMISRVTDLIQSTSQFDPENRERLEYYLRYISSRLMTLKGQTRGEILTHLIEKANASKTLESQFTAIADIFYEVFDNDASLSFKERVLGFLQSMRQKESNEYLPADGDPSRCYLIETLGLKRNRLFIPCPGGKAFLKVSLIMMEKGVGQLLFDVDYVSLQVFDLSKRPVFQEDMLEWWKQWCQRQEPSMQAKLLDALNQAEPQIGVIPLYVQKDNQKFMDVELLAAMLYQMGIFDLRSLQQQGA